MANLKELRNRITSVSSTMQITSAMKMVSAAKLNKAQDAITKMRPYAEKLTELLQNLSASLEGDAQSPYTQVRPVEKVLIVPISSNRGLAGAFNSNIVKRTNALVNEYASAEVELFSIGKKANDILKKNQTVIDVNTNVTENPTYDEVAEIAEYIMKAYADKTYDKIIFVYNSFKNAATQIVKAEQFLPLETSTETPQDAASTEYIYEPSKVEILNELIPKSLKIQLFKALRDSIASEHGARMTAMHKATDNATELRDGLKLSYNKARQAAITNEILEIVAGAEALSS
ncbi:ATP synthase F1 subcomplex gamma subunit [Psychroflexus salarius]|uniref:ATP synthase gamma chain n=1 Tax=Psychroflexus salarius TaxID=1155689 RepID=A0A1M4VM68_9FLAO|nr:ATP synthase F1 subunit gamma [Psychroflexus salarius]SHE69945.1 ATP synthase F1 subcomplex gamma subunit [Psychroflexus salarius]